MAASNKLSFSLSGRPMAALLEGAAATGFFETAPPKFAINGETSKAPARWLARLAAAKSMTQAFWPEDPRDDYGLKAFRGDGHEALVSRRWLEFGPWELIRRPGDLSIVLFHELDANKKSAAKQAGPGHERTASWETGGYVRRPSPFKGLHEAKEHKLETVVDARGKVTQQEMNNTA